MSKSIKDLGFCLVAAVLIGLVWSVVLGVEIGFFLRYTIPAFVILWFMYQVEKVLAHVVKS